MKSLLIEVNKRTDIEFFINSQNSIFIEVEAEGPYDVDISVTKEISRETLKSYIEKLQEIYEYTETEGN